eukprot:TRINITY_DN35080_c0_g1_i3.p1 TRINITY_DN35080_c0_g1~~TRINITY_DN35080_c0_g1_i3.p1  ORF type:complete len:402 (-),score=14.21 TRINITY_DN35080_c0_g1_i3:636-1841(-)
MNDNFRIAQESCLKERYLLKRSLGSGSYGIVKLAYDIKEQQYVAVKMIARASQITNTKYLLREVLNHQKLFHPHVVQLRDDLLNYIKKYGPLTEKRARWFCQQQVFALDYIHQMGVSNRDIKLENCLVSQPPDINKPILKLCDFGFSKDEGQSCAKSIVGTIMYMAPEVLTAAQSGSYEGEKADVWSCGIMLYRMLFSRFPFCRSSEKRANIYTSILNGEIHFPSSQPISLQCRDLLYRMLDRDPATRASLKEVMMHPWFLTDLPDGFLRFNEVSIGLQRKGRVRMPCTKSSQQIREIVNEAAFLPSRFREHSVEQSPPSLEQLFKTINTEQRTLRGGGKMLKHSSKSLPSNERQSQVLEKEEISKYRLTVKAFKKKVSSFFHYGQYSKKNQQAIVSQLQA